MEIFSTFCGLLRISELYVQKIRIRFLNGYDLTKNLIQFCLFFSDFSFPSGSGKSALQYVSSRSITTNVCQHQINIQIPCRISASTSKFTAQIREQMSSPDLHVFTLKFLALKNCFFSLFGGQKMFLKCFLLCNFSLRAL